MRLWVRSQLEARLARPSSTRGGVTSLACVLLLIVGLIAPARGQQPVETPAEPAAAAPGVATVGPSEPFPPSVAPPQASDPANLDQRVRELEAIIKQMQSKSDPSGIAPISATLQDSDFRCSG